jgi:glycosyltransferase involved in cell wall biosynthesis
VLVTQTGALPEYVREGETGWVIPPADAGALTRCLQAALGDPVGLSRMGCAAKERYKRERQIEGSTLRVMYASVLQG